MWKKLLGLSSSDSQSNEDKPIHAAARESVGALRKMLDCKPALRDDPGWYSLQPIHVAAEAGQVGCVNLLLKLGASSDDPPVFSFDDGEERSHEQIGRSIWEFIESLVIDYELWSEDGVL